MDYLSFVSEITKSLAWPIVTVVGIFAFRQEIILLIPRIKKAKIGNTEFEFDIPVSVLAEKYLETAQPPKIANREKELAATDPKRAVIETWMRIETAARRVFYKLGIAYTGTPHTPFLSCVKELEDKGIVTFDESILVRELQILRNRVIQDREFRPSVESVEQYIELSKTVILKLEEEIGNR